MIKEISKIEGIKWIRVLYCYAEEIYDELIDEIANNEKVVKYLDIPIQHISDNILKLMGRKGRKQDIINKINKTKRKSIQELFLRTSFIVGFPGETEEDFNELNNFIKEYKFDKLGVFKYSQEEDTPQQKWKIKYEEIKKKREEELMIVQQGYFKRIK